MHNAHHIIESAALLGTPKTACLENQERIYIHQTVCENIECNTP